MLKNNTKTNQILTIKLQGILPMISTQWLTWKYFSSFCEYCNKRIEEIQKSKCIHTQWNHRSRTTFDEWEPVTRQRTVSTRIPIWRGPKWQWRCIRVPARTIVLVLWPKLFKNTLTRNQQKPTLIIAFISRFNYLSIKIIKILKHYYWLKNYPWLKLKTESYINMSVDSLCGIRNIHVIEYKMMIHYSFVLLFGRIVIQ